MIAPNSIINGDCLEVMKDIADRSIDCIIADLPYGITACKWDLVIPFDKLWEQYKRIIKPNGAIALFGSQPFTSALVMSNPKWFKYEWIWEKNKGSNFASIKYQPIKAHENVLIFGSGRVNYYPIRENRSPLSLKRDPIGNQRTKKPKLSAIKSSPLNGIFKIDYTYSIDGTRNPFSYQRFSLDYSFDHPTQKPVALIEYLIKTYTQEGELILDNTAGSGTLAIAAINTNRQYICIEKDPHYFEVMRNRIANHDPFAPVKTKKPKAAPKGQLTLFDGGLAV
jgi:site-specific DNA-methyltransferase (adenine-specific)